jgi:hypothetical protein
VKAFSPAQHDYILSPEFSYAGYFAAFPEDAERSPESLSRHLRRYRRVTGQQTIARGGFRVDDVVFPQDLITVKEPATDDDLRAYLDILKAQYAARRKDSPTQEFTEWTPTVALPVGLVFTGDWHIGSGGTDHDALDRDIAAIKGTEGLFAVGMGDYVEGVGPKNKAAPALVEGGDHDGDRQEALALLLASELEPQWVALMAGNHDEWMRASAGVSRTSRLFRPLGCPLFHQGGGTVFANVGAERYVIAVSHRGTGKGGNSVLNTTNAQRRTWDAWPEWENADVVCLGHFHYNDQQVIDRKGRPVHYLRSGTYKLIDPYAASLGVVPQRGTPMIILYPDTHLVLSYRGDRLSDGIEKLQLERERYRQHDLETVIDDWMPPIHGLGGLAGELESGL